MQGLFELHELTITISIGDYIMIWTARIVDATKRLSYHTNRPFTHCQDFVESFDTAVESKHCVDQCRKWSGRTIPGYRFPQAASCFFDDCFTFQSATAALIASSASILQWSFTGGSLRWAAISAFWIARISSTVFPFTHSVATEELAIAEPHPKVLNFDSVIIPFSSTLIWSFITSPQAGAPTRPFKNNGKKQRKWSVVCALQVKK